MRKDKQNIICLAVAALIVLFLLASFLAASHVDGEFQDQRRCLLCQFLQLLVTFLALAFNLLLYRLTVTAFALPADHLVSIHNLTFILKNRGPPASSR